MLNILKKKKNTFGYSEFTQKINGIMFKEKDLIQEKFDRKEYYNTIFYPSNKEWFSIIYCYKKSYAKALIILDKLVNYLYTTYFNMSENFIKWIFKRRRSNKTRYSADKIYISRQESRHTNNELMILLYVYKKKIFNLERVIRKAFVLKRKNKKNKEEFFNKLWSILKERFLLFEEWKRNISYSIPNYIGSNLKLIPYIKHTISKNIFFLRRKYDKLEQVMYKYVSNVNFNQLKSNGLFINYKKLGINSMIEKIYHKKIEVKLVTLKSIHLNSDVFSSAVALKLRDRKNKAVRVLRKAINQMTKIPDLHTIRIFDDYEEQIGEISLVSEKIYNTNIAYVNDHLNNTEENNFLNNIKQQVVSGVRFEASGRLTRRLTAMRAVFKYRYTGSLKNLRSSINNKPSTILRGNLKSNGQYIVLEHKTRNGAFGLKGWVSSHHFSWYEFMLKIESIFDKIESIFDKILERIFHKIRHLICNILGPTGLDVVENVIELVVVVLIIPLCLVWLSFFICLFTCLFINWFLVNIWDYIKKCPQYIVNCYTILRKKLNYKTMYKFFINSRSKCLNILTRRRLNKFFKSNSSIRNKKKNIFSLLNKINYKQINYKQIISLHNQSNLFKFKDIFKEFFSSEKSGLSNRQLKRKRYVALKDTEEFKGLSRRQKRKLYWSIVSHKKWCTYSKISSLFGQKNKD